MSYPTNNVHRSNRRALGKNQSTSVPPVTTAITGSASTVTVTFSRPVNIAGPLPITVATLTIVSQTVVSPTVVTILMSGAVATHAYVLASPVANVSTYEGGQALGGSGTF